MISYDSSPRFLTHVSYGNSDKGISTPASWEGRAVFREHSAVSSSLFKHLLLDIIHSCSLNCVSRGFLGKRIGSVIF